MKVMKFEEAPDPRLRWMDEKTDRLKRQLEKSRGLKHDFNRDVSLLLRILLAALKNLFD
jgi:hypothetical protein